MSAAGPIPTKMALERARHRLSRTGNRQLNAALHRIALTQAHWHPDAKALIAAARPAVTAASRPFVS